MEMNDRKAAAYRLGLITLIILAVLTVAEYFVSIYTGSLILLMIVALIKAAIIVNNFMHITRLWRGEESH
jgi:heme/copper-type cytochrome/quinol oxidase subunit 4